MLRFVRSWSAISRSLPQFAPARRPHARRRFTLERLEERAMLSTIALTVNTLADDPSGPTTGQFTLRDAITQADNDQANQYVISIPVKGTIDLTSALPTLQSASNITIKGPGPLALKVQRDPNAVLFSVFMVDKDNMPYTSETVILSGMTIAGGNTPYGQGGGIFNYGGILTVTDSIFADNSASLGGGICNLGTLTVTNSVFINNTATEAGGGIFSNGMLKVNDSVFANNSGCGICNNSGTVIVTGSAFANNSAPDGEGGGLFNNGGPGTTAIVTSSAFTNNSAYNGGGIGNAGALTVTDSIFAGNTAINGGGLENDGSSSATVKGSSFTGNSASVDGGGLDNYGAATVTNSTFSGNSATDFGGGIYAADAILTTVDHSTISGNTASLGGGLYVSRESQAEIDYSTINDPNGGGIVNNGSTVPLKKTVVDGVLYNDQYYS